MPLPALVQFENDLHPDPARLAWELRLVRDRLDKTERDIKKIRCELRKIRNAGRRKLFDDNAR